MFAKRTTLGWATLVLFAACLSACNSRNHSESVDSTAERLGVFNGNSSSESDAKTLLFRIQEGMTFRAITQIVPLSTNLRAYSGEHGGVWYDVPFGSNYFFQLRFEHPLDSRNPRGKSNINECVLNYPARLKEMHGGQVVATQTNGLPENGE